MNNLSSYLAANSYPGRGIAFGLSEDGMHACIAYFIMGRSANSRNRIFAQRNGGIVTKPADPSRMEDPSLIIYPPVWRHNEDVIVTNGDQTDTIAQFLANGDTFENALRTRTFEPDAPNYTPRISGLLSLSYGGFSYKLSILKTENAGESLQRTFWEFPQPQPGCGHLIHTYARDEDPLPPYSGEPFPFRFSGTLSEVGETIWKSLNEENKVSLFVCSVSLDGRENSIIYNKYSES